MPKAPARAKYRKKRHNKKEAIDCPGKRPTSKKLQDEYIEFLSGVIAEEVSDAIEENWDDIINDLLLWLNKKG